MKATEKIINSIIELIETNKFESITVKDLCSKADVNRLTYYRNFKSKEDIIQLKIKLILNEYTQEFNKSNNKNRENYIYIILKTFLIHENNT